MGLPRRGMAGREGTPAPARKRGSARAARGTAEPRTARPQLARNEVAQRRALVETEDRNHVLLRVQAESLLCSFAIEVNREIRDPQ